MLKIDSKKKSIEIAGDSDAIIEELSVATVAILEQFAEVDEDYAIDAYKRIVKNQAKALAYLQHECGIDEDKIMKEIFEEPLKRTNRIDKICDELEDAIKNIKKKQKEDD